MYVKFVARLQSLLTDKGFRRDCCIQNKHWYGSEGHSQNRTISSRFFPCTHQHHTFRTKQMIHVHVYPWFFFSGAVFFLKLFLLFNFLIYFFYLWRHCNNLMPRFFQEFLCTVLLVVIFLPKEKDAFVFSSPIPIHVIKQL